MSFQIKLNPFDRSYAHFIAHVRNAIQKTFAEQAEHGLTQKELADTLGVDPALISRRLNGPGNITLRTLSDLYVAMGREPLSNFVAPQDPVVAQQSPITTEISRKVVSLDNYWKKQTRSSQSNTSAVS